MPEEPYIEREAAEDNVLDFEETESGDLVMTNECVLQDMWKQIVMPLGNFEFDLLLGSQLYAIPPFGNIPATHELAKSFIRHALLRDVRNGRLVIEDLAIFNIETNGASFAIEYKDLEINIVTSANFTL